MRNKRTIRSPCPLPSNNFPDILNPMHLTFPIRAQYPPFAISSPNSTNRHRVHTGHPSFVTFSSAIPQLDPTSLRPAILDP